MRLLRCEFSDGEFKPVLKHNKKILDLTTTDIVNVEEDSSSFINMLKQLNKEGGSILKEIKYNAPASAFIRESDINIAAPLGSSGRFFALGGVYMQHLRERNDSLNKVPSQWVVPKTAVIGPDEPILLPDQVKESVMPAVELCIVIGKKGRYINEENIIDYVAGYTISNDITARTDWPGPMGYKLMDTFSPCGPGIVPVDQIDDISSLEMTLHQGENCICRGSTASMRFSIQFLVSYLSSILELQPGDIISMGDPGRVQNELVVGETIQASIENVGTLQNPVESM